MPIENFNGLCKNIDKYNIEKYLKNKIMKDQGDSMHVLVF